MELKIGSSQFWLGNYEIVKKMSLWGSAPNPDEESSAAPEGRPGGGSVGVDTIVHSIRIF